MSHIPGPWAICDEPPNPYWEKGRTIGAASDSDARRVCDVFAFGEPEEGSIPWHNARLIAAAPCLLSALKAFLESYLRSANSGDWGYWNPEEEPEVIAARAAIAKARGEK